MKIVLIVTLILLCNSSFSQNEFPLKKGNITLDGEVYINYNKEKNESSGFSYENLEQKFLTVGLNPQVGYFVVDQLVVGLSIPLSYQKSYASRNDLGSSYFAMGIAPYAKYYFVNKFFIQLSAGYEFGKNKFENADTKETIKGFTIIPTIGYAFFINSKISLEPSISYAYSKKILRILI